MDFEDTMTEADFTRPLLEPSEEHAMAAAHAEMDLTVDGLRQTLVSRLVGLFQGKAS